MRSPEQKRSAFPQTGGRRSEEELPLRYLSPGAFTILSPQDYGVNPDPPTAPAQYRLTPTSNRRRIQAFSIIAETSSNPGSRSPSPSGRLSPFRGRGFNPAGSRHASPNPSPTPDDSRQSSASRTSLDSIRSPRKSQIPQLKSRGSASNIFGEKVTTQDSRTRARNRSKLSPQLSQSLTNISSRHVPNKSMKRRPAFEQLSPITGSSPDSGSTGNKSQSSPSKIPLSCRSQPSSRKSSPTRGRSPHNNRVSRQDSKGGSRNASRSNSRETSPSKGYSRIPIAGSSYRDLPPRPSTLNKSKPKVPPKPHELKSGAGSKSKLVKRSSEAKLKRNSGNSTNTTNGDDDDDEDEREQSINSSYRSNGSGKGREQRTDKTKVSDRKTSGANSKRNETARGNSGKSNSKQGNNNSTKNKHKSNSKGMGEDEIIVMEEDDNGAKPELRTRESSTKLIDIPTATVVSSTTTTAVQPLKIEEDLENMLKEELGKVSGYANDGRILSATSVSSAMNKMNDTVLNSQTLLRDHNFTKLSPAASAIISLSNDNKALDTKSATTALPTIESIHKKIDGVGQNINSAFADSNKVYMESIDSSVKNNMIKAITPDHPNVFVQKGGAQDKILDGRTLVAPDVKPIKILVKEKASDIEVQSGNVRLPSSVTNGLNSSPSLPPSQPETHDSDHEDEETAAKKNCCLRLLSRCKCKRPFCKRWKKKKADRATPIKKAKSSLNCFSCRKKKLDSDRGSISTAPVGDDGGKMPGCCERLRCCKSKKVGDKTWCSRGRRKDSWVEKQQVAGRENAQQSKTSCKDKCKNAFRAIFCCGVCCGKKRKVEEDQVARRESMISKKKSLTPQALPPPDTRPKIDISLVEHTSLMRGAIPILPVPVAWFCLICNIFLPGVGTVLSGMFCLCLGKPRFSQNDGPRPRLGAFVIDFIIGCGQLFTVLFCLVGWGWSIWWGVIMLKVARKHKRIRLVEERTLAQAAAANHQSRDAERGS